MIIVNKQTLEVFSVSEIANRYSHIVWDFSDEAYLKPMLVGLGLDLVEMPDCPICDYDIFNLVPTNVRRDGLKYLADWSLVPIDQPLEVIAEKKLSQMKYNCGIEITSGFHSAALGETYFYSSDAESQANIQGNVIFSMIAGNTEHVCYSSSGERLIMPHTSEQIVQVGRDFSIHLWAKLKKYHALRTSIESALSSNDLETLLAISWN